jgi:hypothetical protein
LSAGHFSRILQANCDWLQPMNDFFCLTIVAS